MSRTDKVSDRFPVVEELFRHPEIADRLPGAAVNRAFTVLTEGTKGRGEGEGTREGVRKRTFPCCCLYAVCDSDSYTVTTPSCFRYVCLAIFLSLPFAAISFHGTVVFFVSAS